MEIWPSVVFALSTVDTWLETLLPRSTEIALDDAGGLMTGPATRVAAPAGANCAAMASRISSAGSLGPSADVACGVTMTARLAPSVGVPLLTDR